MQMSRDYSKDSERLAEVIKHHPLGDILSAILRQVSTVDRAGVHITICSCSILTSQTSGDGVNRLTVLPCWKGCGHLAPHLLEP